MFCFFFCGGGWGHSKVKKLWSPRVVIVVVFAIVYITVKMNTVLAIMIFFFLIPVIFIGTLKALSVSHYH